VNHLKYSVLFMRDDTDVRRFRISPMWLKAFLYFQGFLLLLSIVGISVGVTFWSSNAGLRAERKASSGKAGSAPAEVPPQPKLPPVSLKTLFERANTGLVTVDSFQARVSGNDMTVNFELTNVQSASTLSGAAELTLIRNDGQVLDVEANKADLSFQIQRFKHFRTSFNLPKGLDRRDVFGLRLEIKGSDGKTIFSDTYPLRDSLAS